MNLVKRYRQKRNDVVARIVRLGFPRQAGALRRNLHVRAGDHGSGVIGNCSGETACRLSVQRWGYKTNQCTTTYRKKRFRTQHCNSSLRRLAPKEKTLPPRGSFLAADTAYKCPSW